MFPAISDAGPDLSAMFSCSFVRFVLRIFQMDSRERPRLSRGCPEGVRRGCPKAFQKGCSKNADNSRRGWGGVRVCN